MKVRVGVTQDEIEIGQLRLFEKGARRGFFTIVFHPSGQKILDCCYFEKDARRWFTFPQKEIKGKDGGGSEYIPLVSYLNKEYLDQLKVAVLESLKHAQPQEQYGKKVQANTGETHQVRASASSGWEDCPF